MMPRFAKKITLSVALALGCFALSQQVRADLVTFDDHTGPSTFAAAGPPQTLVYTFTDVTATFTGGVVLTGETAQTTDNSSVYATDGPTLGGLGTTNPIVVNFSSAIQNFQIDILNAIAGNYVMTDNAGHSMPFSLTGSGSSIATEGFAAAGTQVTITDLSNANGWDFAIDNVTFNQALTVGEPSTPVPAALPMGLVSLATVGGLALIKRRRQLAV